MSIGTALAALTITLFVFATPPTSAASAKYTLVDLGPVSGVAMNDRGEVTGEASSHHAFRFNGKVIEDLGTLGGDSRGVAINNSGQVAGVYFTLAGTTHGFLSSPGAAMIDIGTLGGTSSDVVATFSP